MAYTISKIWFYPVFRILIKRTYGIENIPNNSNFIIVSNHEKLIDPLFIVYLMLKRLNRKVHFLATPTWWFLGEKICRKWAGCIPLFNPKQAYNEMKDHIKKGNIVGIFPEGHLDEKVRYPKTGAVRLALETKTPILPVGIKSSYWPFSTTIRVGKLIYLKKKNIKEQAFQLIDYAYQLKIGRLKKRIC